MGNGEAKDTSPSAWMHGFPPALDRRVRFSDGSFLKYPQSRWSFNNMEQLVPTKAVWRGGGAVRDLSAGDPLFAADIERDTRLETLDGRGLSFEAALVESDTDALLVLHHGRVVYERYFGACGPHVRHTMMSCNKSMIGTLAECLISDGLLDDAGLVPDIIPELGGSAWGDATVRHVLNMVIGMEFSEDYLDRSSDVWRFLRSTGMIPANAEADGAIADVLPTIGKAGQHGQAFAYREPNIFVLGWILRRVAGVDVATLASERIWQHLGAEHDWLYMVDPSGAETTALATARDFARFGQLICDRGLVDGHQVIPPTAIEAVLAGGDIDVFARGDRELPDTWSYRSQWWYRHRDDRVCPVARGAQGQLLYIDPVNELVIARYASPRMLPPETFDNLWWPIVDMVTAAATTD
ncbi:MAG: serine hydrolase domain-containing protein [Acidimicrobiales bacterium]